MTVAALMDDLRRRGVEIVADGKQLRYRPMSAVGTELRAAIIEHKATILEMLAGSPESDLRRNWVFDECNRRMREALGLKNDHST